MANNTYVPTSLLCFCSVSDMSKFYFENEKLKEIILSNGYSNKFIHKYISKSMNRLYNKKNPGKISALVKSGIIR